MKIVHFTREDNWKIIQQEGLLLPRTNPDNYGIGIPTRLGRVIPFIEYVVGIPIEAYQGWIDSGLRRRLFQYTSGEVALSVPCLELAGAFVRDHSLHCPTKLKKEIDIDILDEEFQDSLCNEVGELNKEGKRIQRLVERVATKHKREYYLSSIPLADYRGQFRAPEVWLAQQTPVQLIRRISLDIAA